MLRFNLGKGAWKPIEPIENLIRSKKLSQIDYMLTLPRSVRNLSRQPKSNREKNAERIKRVIDTCLDDLDRINYSELSLS